jgi:aminopeptidase-like protein
MVESARGVFTVDALDEEGLRSEAEALLRRLFPICRSITGEGVRQTLRELQETAPFQAHEIPSGTTCFDWTVPDEWTIRDACIETPEGERLIDFRENNLHVVSYSEPVDAVLSFDELAPHLHSLPGLPQAIPYRTTYYKRDWGFCLSHEQLQRMDRRVRYRVVIDSDLAPGSLTYGEALLPGTSGEEYLVSTYCCHPSLANDNLSGVVLWTLLLREMQQRPRRHSYRFVIAPETIGAIAYLARNRKAMERVQGGFVVTTVAGPGRFGYKGSCQGGGRMDGVVERAFAEIGIEPIRYPFDINGSDERQYSSPGFRIPVVTITKDKYYEYDYYHTSLDDLSFISAANLIESLALYLRAIENLELDQLYRSLNPYGEPMLGKRGLYPQTGGAIRQKAAGAGEPDPARPGGDELEVMRWVMFFSDGKTSLLEMSERTGLPMRKLYEAAENLREHRLLERPPQMRRGAR